MRLLFDECIGRGIYGRFKPQLDALAPPIESIHALDYNQRQGLRDEEWIPRAAREQWIIITGDTGSKRLGVSIRAIMLECGVTGVYFGGGLQQSRADVKLAALMSLLPRLREIDAAPRGSQFRLVMHGAGGFVLRPWVAKPDR